MQTAAEEMREDAREFRRDIKRAAKELTGKNNKDV
jgi:hypothetical protein